MRSAIAAICTDSQFSSRDPLGDLPGTTTHANPYAYSLNDPTNRADPTGLRSDDCSMATDVCVIDDLGGPAGTTDDGSGGRTVKEGAGRQKADYWQFWKEVGCQANQNCGFLPYQVWDYTDEIYSASIHAVMDTRLVFGVIAQETNWKDSVASDTPPGIWLDRDEHALGPGNITEGAFNETIQRHADLFSGRSWDDVTTDKLFAAKITAFRLRDLEVDLSRSIERNGVTRIFRPHACERRGERSQAVFCRSTLLTFAYTKRHADTVGGKLFDQIFQESRRREYSWFPQHGNAEFRPADGSLTNAVTPRLGEGWDYYCGSGGFFLC